MPLDSVTRARILPTRSLSRSKNSIKMLSLLKERNVPRDGFLDAVPLIARSPGHDTLLQGEIWGSTDTPVTGENSWKRRSSVVCVGTILVALLVMGGIHRRRDRVSPFPKRLSRVQSLESLYGGGPFAGRSWLQHIEHLRPEGLAPLTLRSQQFIDHWQNPKDCRNKTFLLLTMSDTTDLAHGLGSTVHLITRALNTAISAGAILMWNKEAFGRVFVDDDCKSDGIRSLDCLFEPLSTCPRWLITPENSRELSVFQSLPDIPDLGAPPLLVQELSALLSQPLTFAAYVYWWKAQAAAYILRLNSESLDTILRGRLDPLQHYGYTRNSESNISVAMNMPWPLPQGTSSFHIRHGDKGSEMSLHPFSEYAAQGARLAQLNPLYYRKSAFVSSEDPLVFREARNMSDYPGDLTTPNRDWVFFQSEINRINGGPHTQLGAFGSRNATTLSWMSELLLALECSAFVGTRGSNWNRLIDELRCVWIDSCQSPYLEVGPDKDWVGYP